MSGFGRFKGLARKEVFQVMRDPSSLLIAFVLPIVLLFLFAFAVSLDNDNVPFAVVVEGQGPAANELASAYTASAYLDTRVLHDRREADPLLTSGAIRGYAIIPSDFESRLVYGTAASTLQIVTDGSQPNTANFTAGYAMGIYRRWLAGRNADRLGIDPTRQGASVSIEPRYWFNAELDSRRVLLPGAIAIVMAMIGTLLTALVVAREWERGTMEALLSTPANALEIVLAKLTPYFLLGLIAVALCTLLSMGLFSLPMRGSPGALLLLSVAFLLPALGQGLLISTLARNQFIAAQVALLSGFLPAFLLSGFLYEIASMPAPIRWLTTIIGARWYVEGLQTIFLAGNIWALLWKDVVLLTLIGGAFLLLAVKTSSTTIDGS